MSGLAPGDVRARAVRMLELIEDSRRYDDGSLPAPVVLELSIHLEGLEHDLEAVGPNWQPKPPGARCRACGKTAEWPGLLEAHVCSVDVRRSIGDEDLGYNPEEDDDWFGDLAA